MSWLSHAILSLKHGLHRKFIYRTVRSIAKTQLRTFYAGQSRFPNLSDEELYFHTIMSRPGYTEESTRQILERAKSSVQWRQDAPLRLLDVVHALVLEEVPMELDSVVRENIKSRFDYFDDQPRTEMSYSTYYEIVCEIDLFPN